MEEKKLHGSEEIEIDFSKWVEKLKKRKKILPKAVIAGLILGIIVAFSLPKQYTVTVTLSPEAGKSSNGGGLSNMASMFGVNMGSAEQDALNFSMFPDIIASSPFLLEIYNIPVETITGEKYLMLVDYLKNQKSPWWSCIFQLPGKIVSGMKTIFSEKENKDSLQHAINPFRLTPEQAGNLMALKSTMKADVDKKSDMTKVTVTFQDPLVAAIVADTAVAKLQEYITNYRIKKAKEDCEYLEKLRNERKQEYYDAQMKYAKFMDANRGLSLESVRIESERLQNASYIANQVYSQVETQLQVARAKVQEAKPVFAVVEPATVPLHASGPNKMLIFIAFIFLGLMAGVLWVLWGEDLWYNIRKG
ncbi:Wzz/FepE/Etk N-terminal domain-containing protein [Phocaeicola faecalis]